MSRPRTRLHTPHDLDPSRRPVALLGKLYPAPAPGGIRLTPLLQLQLLLLLLPLLAPLNEAGPDSMENGTSLSARRG
jgi:hypothetical protein